jgi:hypothetical protein
MNLPTSTGRVFDEAAWYQEQEKSHPFRYNVVVCRDKDENEVLLGHIVTHLELDDYCALHKLQLVKLQFGTRRAFPHERTELI